MKNFFRFTFIFLFILCFYSVSAGQTITADPVTGDAANSCSVSGSVVTCPTKGSNTFYMTLRYTKGDETALIITPKHNLSWATATYFGIGVEDSLNSSTVSNIFYSLTVPKVFKYTADAQDTVLVFFPEFATNVSFTVSYTGSASAGTSVAIGGMHGMAAK